MAYKLWNEVVSDEEVFTKALKYIPRNQPKTDVDILRAVAYAHGQLILGGYDVGREDVRGMVNKVWTSTGKK